MNEPDIARVPESRCLDCGKTLDALGTGDKALAARPEPGDVTVCIRCGAVMKLDEKLRLRGLTDAEMDELVNSRETMQELAKVVRAIHVVRHMVG